MPDHPLAEHYLVLDAPTTASADEIREIYRDLAQVWHPDRFAKNPRLQKKAEQKLKTINEAYEAIRAQRPSAQPEPTSNKPPSKPTPPDSIPPEEADALGWYAKAAIEGHPDAQCIIATMYAEGDQVPHDESKALHWFRKSAGQEHAAAEYQIGLRYYAGSSLPKDPQKAFTYYQRAAIQNHPKAQFCLGIMLSNGQHVQQDTPLACAWFEIAAQSGNPEARDLLDSIQDSLTKPEKKKFQRHLERLKATIST